MLAAVTSMAMLSLCGRAGPIFVASFGPPQEEALYVVYPALLLLLLFVLPALPCEAVSVRLFVALDVVDVVASASAVRQLFSVLSFPPSAAAPASLSLLSLLSQLSAVQRGRERE